MCFILKGIESNNDLVHKLQHHHIGFILKGIESCTLQSFQNAYSVFHPQRNWKIYPPFGGKILISSFILKGIERDNTYPFLTTCGTNNFILKGIERTWRREFAEAAKMVSSSKELKASHSSCTISAKKEFRPQRNWKWLSAGADAATLYCSFILKGIESLIVSPRYIWKFCFILKGIESNSSWRGHDLDCLWFHPQRNWKL